MDDFWDCHVHCFDPVKFAFKQPIKRKSSLKVVWLQMQEAMMCSIRRKEGINLARYRLSHQGLPRLALCWSADGYSPFLPTLVQQIIIEGRTTVLLLTSPPYLVALFSVFDLA